MRDQPSPSGEGASSERTASSSHVNSDAPLDGQAEVGKVEGAPGSDREWRVIVRSIGTAGAAIVGALRRVLPYSEEQLAVRLYQAPSELIRDIDSATAQAIVAILCEAGVDAEAGRQDEAFTPGDAAYDVALVIEDVSRLIHVVREIALFLGVGFEQAQRIAYSCPAELIGKVSSATVDALRSRFNPLGAEVDASRIARALYDVFLEPCAPGQEAQVRRKLQDAGVADRRESHFTDHPMLLCAGLGKAECEKLCTALKPLGAGTRIVNRDFQRFDLRLENAPDTADVALFLAASAGMPEHVARKISTRTPVVTHHNVRYDEAGVLVATAGKLGATLSAHLLALQRFRLHLAKVRNPQPTWQILEALAGLDPEHARREGRTGATIESPATLVQARSLQLQLKQVGTDAQLMMI